MKAKYAMIKYIKSNRSAETTIAKRDEPFNVASRAISGLRSFYR